MTKSTTRVVSAMRHRADELRARLRQIIEAGFEDEGFRANVARRMQLRHLQARCARVAAALDDTDRSRSAVDLGAGAALSAVQRDVDALRVRSR